MTGDKKLIHQSVAGSRLELRVGDIRGDCTVEFGGQHTFILPPCPKGGAVSMFDATNAKAFILSYPLIALFFSSGRVCGTILQIAFMKSRRLTALMMLLGAVPLASADWSATTRATTYYTSDVGLFTASQRLSRDADPTQPALDTRLTGQGGGGVMETMAQMTNSSVSDYGKTILDVRGDGYVFYDHTQYSNGNVGIQAKQILPTETSVMLRYYYNPDLFLGNNLEHQSGLFKIAPERVTSQIAALHLGQKIGDDMELILFSRYGTRRYDQAFNERDTDFWSVGPHFDWEILPKVTLGLAYHYERGTAAGRYQPQFNDDVSYINNFAAADLDIELEEKWTISLAFDYEKNNWLSQFQQDDRNGAIEQVFFGEALIRYRVEENVSLHAGVQHGRRKMNVEPVAVMNTNVGMGVKAEF